MGPTDPSPSVRTPRLFSFRGARHARPSPQRLFAFVDGVFAIAATLLVLELRLPDPLPAGGLGHALFELRGHFAAYAVGFLQTFGGWSVSHRLSSRVRAVDQWMVLALGIGLAFVSLIPFSTLALAASLGDEGNFRTAVSFLTFIALASTTSLAAATFHAWRAKLFIPECNDAHFRWLALLMTASLVGFAVALAVSFVAPWLALAPVIAGYAATLLPLRMDEFPVAAGERD